MAPSPANRGTSRSPPRRIWREPRLSGTVSRDEPRVGLGFDVHARDARRVSSGWAGVLRGRGGARGAFRRRRGVSRVADALLGATALGDIGQHFPDTDPGRGDRRTQAAPARRRRAGARGHGARAGVVRCDHAVRSPGDRTASRGDAASRSRGRWTSLWSACRSRRPAPKAWGSPATASAASRSRPCDERSNDRRRPARGRRGASGRAGVIEVLVAPGVRETQGFAPSWLRPPPPAWTCARRTGESSTGWRPTTKGSSRDCATTPNAGRAGGARAAGLPVRRRRARRRPGRDHGSSEPRRCSAIGRGGRRLHARHPDPARRRCDACGDPRVRRCAPAPPHARVANIPRALDRLQGVGFTVVGLDGDASSTIFDDPCPEGRVALVVGSEGEGMSRLVRERCDVLVSLPMRGRVGSLNASASLAAALYGYVLPSRRT